MVARSRLSARLSTREPSRSARLKELVEKHSVAAEEKAAVKVDGLERSLGLNNSLKSSLKSADMHLSKAFAGGRVYCSSLVDKLLCEAFYNSRIIRIIELMVLGDSNGARLFVHQLPAELAHKSFSEVFSHFVHRLHLVPIGIYRAESCSSAGGSPERPAPYCYTNPLPSAVVEPDDKLFVLGAPR